jgi:hypothetical protein
VGCHLRWNYLAIGCPLEGLQRKENQEKGPEIHQKKRKRKKNIL